MGVTEICSGCGEVMSAAFTYTDDEKWEPLCYECSLVNVDDDSE